MAHRLTRNEIAQLVLRDTEIEQHQIGGEATGPERGDEHVEVVAGKEADAVTFADPLGEQGLAHPVRPGDQTGIGHAAAGDVVDHGDPLGIARRRGPQLSGQPDAPPVERETLANRPFGEGGPDDSATCETRPSHQRIHARPSFEGPG